MAGSGIKECGNAADLFATALGDVAARLEYR
jgi:hypothetical protein